MLILSEEDIRGCFGMDDAIDAVAEAFESFSAGGAEVPLRTVQPIPGRDGNMIVMPGYVGGDAQRAAGTDSMGVKTLGFFEGNRKLGLPTIPATMLVMDPATGMPAALLNGTYLTQLRTAAASGAATRLLARDGARTGALFGCGGQAACQLEALLATRDLDVVYVIDAGSAVIRGLDDATDYYLYETKAPEGFNLLKEPVQFKITAKYNADGSALSDGNPTVTIGAGEPSTKLSTDVVNKAGAELPSTGGVGTTVFYVVGGLLVAVAVVLLVTKKKMSADK